MLNTLDLWLRCFVPSMPFICREGDEKFNYQQCEIVDQTIIGLLVQSFQSTAQTVIADALENARKKLNLGKQKEKEQARPASQPVETKKGDASGQKIASCKSIMQVKKIAEIHKIKVTSEAPELQEVFSSLDCAETV